MSVGQARGLGCVLLAMSAAGVAQQPGQSPSSSSKHAKSSSARLLPDIGSGSVANGVYRNRALALSCKIPAGWVLRTDEMNTREEGTDSENSSNAKSSPQGTQGSGGQNGGGRVLLAAFSRPPEAKGEDVNSSLVIAAEPVAAYPGLREASQYLGALTEVAKAQGFSVDDEPYEIQIGTKVVVRGDFHKDIGSRVMRQSTLVFLAQAYAVSITVIAGTQDDVEELVDGVSFGAGK